MKYKLTNAFQVGDFTNSTSVEEMHLHSISVTFDPQGPMLSVVLEHKASGWKHNVVYRDSEAVRFWAVTMEKEFDAICEAVIEKISADQKVPPGSVEK